MSTPNNSINISQQNVKGKCDLKCAYNFDYQESSLTARNMGALISLTYDNSKTPPVLYNNEKYTVTGIIITSPSIHNFNNSTTAAAEIVIEHTQVTGGKQMFVGIPFVASSESSEASNLITEVIQSVANNAPSRGETTNINIAGFTLQKIIPKKPFFSYSQGQNDWIVYGLIDAIPLNNSTITSLQQIIQPFPIPIPGGDLFYNSKGPNTGSIGEGIYISCQPTDSSEEEMDVSYAKNTTTTSGFSLNSPLIFILLLIVLGCAVFIVLFIVLNYGFSYLTNTKPIVNKLTS